MTLRLLILVLAVVLACGTLEPASAALVMPDDGGGTAPPPGQRPTARSESAERQRTRATTLKRGTDKPEGRVAKNARQPSISLKPLPDRHLLGDLPFEFQRLNNCGPVTTNMVLGHYGINLSQHYTASKLRPSPRDVSVDDIEMVTFAQIEYGYRGQVVLGGNMRLMEAFIANDIPVIVLQLLDLDSDIDHFRVIHGYDRVRGVVTVSDSIRGRNLEWSYEYFDSLWNRRGYEYALIYPPKKAALVNAITSRYRADEPTLEREELRRMKAFVDASPANPWAWLQLGQALYYWDHYGEALRAWSHAKELGLPQKALWYNVWPIALMNKLGRHEEARDLASNVIANNPVSTEAYFERARANYALGKRSVVGSDLRLALEYAPYQPRVREAYEKYDEGRWVD